MKRYQRILSLCGGLSLLVILLISSASALLTDREQEEVLFEYDASTVNITLHVDYEDIVKNDSGNLVIDPGEEFTIEPWIENAGSGNVYVFIELDVPVVPVYDESAQEVVNGSLFTFAPSDGWYLFDADLSDEYSKYYYCYGTSDSLTELQGSNSLDDGPKSTNTLLSESFFSNVVSDTDLFPTLIIKAYAVTTEAYEESGIGSPAQVWEATVKVAGE